jgi:hypothetical protein
VANYTSNTVSILLGRGDGTFQVAVNYAAGSGPHSLGLGDFNGDGNLDLAVAGDSGVGIMLGRGDGSFAPLIKYGPSGQSVVVGDFNGDGNLDLAEDGTTTVEVLLGNGNGTFQAPHSYAAGFNPWSLAVGDFNGDAILDIAVADNVDRNGTGNVLLGNGDGTFQDPVSYATGSSTYAVAVGDFNKAGLDDLAVVNHGSGTVSVLIANSDGTFQKATNYPITFGPLAVAVGDFTGNGFLDLAVADYNSVRILLNAADWDTGHPPVPGKTRSPAVNSPASRSLSLDPLTAQGLGSDAQAQWLPPPRSSQFLAQPGRPVSGETEYSQLALPAATATPRPLVTARHVPLARVDEWTDPLAGEKQAKGIPAS